MATKWYAVAPVLRNERVVRDHQRGQGASSSREAIRTLMNRPLCYNPCPFLKECMEGP